MTMTEYQGVWWLARKPTEQFQGTLRVDDDESLRLEVLAPASWSWLQYPDPGMVLGVSGGEYITLHHTSLERSPIGGGDQLASHEFTASSAYIGVHFDSADAVQFSRLVCTIPGLLEWLHPGSYLKMDHGEAPPALTITCSKEIPPAVAHAFGNLAVTFHVSGPDFSHSNLRRIVVEQQASLSLEAPNEIALVELGESLFRLLGLLSLLWGDRAVIAELWATTSKSKRRLYNGQEKEGGIVRIRGAGLAPHQPLPAYVRTPFLAYDGAIGSYLVAWSAAHTTFSPMIDLYESTLRGDRHFQHTRFLALAQALDFYLQRRFPGQYFPEADFRSRVLLPLQQALPQGDDDATKEFGEAAQGPLGRLNHFSFQSRLDHFLRAYQDVLGKWRLEPPFARDLVVTRNYYTHFSPDGKAKAKHGDDLIVLTKKTQFIVEVLLLHELGLSDATLKEIVKHQLSQGRWVLLDRATW